MQWLKRKSYPAFWEQYASCFKTPQDQDVKTLRFVVFDTETTGLNIKTDRLLSIGCVGISDLKIRVTDQLETYVKQDMFEADTVKIHGLLKGGKQEKIEEKAAVIQFLDYVKNSVLVAHHAAFDVTMINKALSRLQLPKLKNKVLDTGHIFRKTKLDTSKVHFGLDELANRFNIPLHDRHTASGDAYITALLFLKLVSKLNTSGNLHLNDLQLKKRIGLL